MKKKIVVILALILCFDLQTKASFDNDTKMVVVNSNDINGFNVLSQAMISEENTIYIIRYDFILQENIIIPKGSTLKFEGGSISGNKTVTGNHTTIVAMVENVFSPSLTFRGSWQVKEVYPEWFGAKGDGSYDDAIAINKCIAFASNEENIPIKILFTRPIYIVGDIINFSQKGNIRFEGTGKNVIQKCVGDFRNMFDGSYSKSIQITNLTLDGSLINWNAVRTENLNWGEKYFNACIKAASNTSDFTIDNCCIKNFNYGVYLGGANEHNRPIDGAKSTDHIVIENCVFENNKMSCIDTYNRFGLYINNNFFKNNGNIAIHIEPTIYDGLAEAFDTSDIFTSRYPADGVNICNNTFVWTDVQGRGVKLYKGVYAANITNNHFINSEASIISESTKMFIISNNTIRNGRGIELYGNLGSGNIYGNILLNVSLGISCYNNGKDMGCIDIHDNMIVLKEHLESNPDAFRVQNSKYHNNIIKGFFNGRNKRKRGVIDISGASYSEIYNNKLLKCQESKIPFFVVPISNEEELSAFIKKGVRIYDNIYEQQIGYQISTNVAKTRPTNPYKGQQFFDMVINKLLIFNGNNWVDTMGNVIN